MAAPKGNKFAVDNKGGRPALFKTPEELESAIERYFEGEAHKREYPTALGGTVQIAVFTITGLAYYLGFESRQSFYDYENNDVFSYIIKRARLRIEMNYEENLSDKAPAGSIFALKNMGWFDRQELTGKDGKDINTTIVFKDFSDAGS